MELKRDIIEIQSQEDSIGKGNTRKILNKKNNIKKEISRKSLENRNRKIMNENENMKKKQLYGKSPMKKRI